jgi:hypothetical protein
MPFKKFLNAFKIIGVAWFAPEYWPAFTRIITCIVGRGEKRE